MGFFVDVTELVVTAQPLNRPLNRCKPRLTAETTGDSIPRSSPAELLAEFGILN